LGEIVDSGAFYEVLFLVLFSVCFFLDWGFYILDSCFVLGFLYGGWFTGRQVSMWRVPPQGWIVRHWARGLDIF